MTGVQHCQTRMGLTEAGVGLPRGLGRLSLNVSDGVMISPCETLTEAVVKVAFSLFSNPFRPLLLFAQPNATLRAVEPTRGRGGRPNTRSSLPGDIVAPCLSSAVLVAGDMMLGLTEICCSTLGWPWMRTAALETFSSTAATMAAFICSVDEADVNDVLMVLGYGEGREFTRERIRRGRNSEGRGP